MYPLSFVAAFAEEKWVWLFLECQLHQMALLLPPSAHQTAAFWHEYGAATCLLH